MKCTNHSFFCAHSIFVAPNLWICARIVMVCISLTAANNDDAPRDLWPHKIKKTHTERHRWRWAELLEGEKETEINGKTTRWTNDMVLKRSVNEEKKKKDKRCNEEEKKRTLHTIECFICFLGIGMLSLRVFLFFLVSSKMLLWLHFYISHSRNV